MNWPAIAATPLMPSASPRWFVGNASVRMACEFAKRKAPPIPCTNRIPMSQIAPAGPVNGVAASRSDPTVKTTKPGVVHPDPAEHVAEPTERHHQHGRHEQVAHEDPEQVAHVPRVERVEVDPA